MVDISTPLAVLVSIASAVIAACAPVVTAAALRHFKVARNSAMGDDIYNAVQAASQLVLHELESVAAHNPAIDIRNASIAKGVQEVLALAPLAVAHFGLTEEKVAAFISGEVAKVLNPPADPAPAVTPKPIPVSPAVS